MSKVKFVGVSKLATTQNAKYLSVINLTKLHICAMMDKAQVTLFWLRPEYKQSDPLHDNNLQFLPKHLDLGEVSLL